MNMNRSGSLVSSGRVPGVLTALRLGTVPFYLVSLLQPHAVLLSWAAVAATHFALQRAVKGPASVSTAAAAASLASIAGEATEGGDGEGDKGGGGKGRGGGGVVVAEGLGPEDYELLSYLGQRMADKRRPDVAEALRGLADKIKAGGAGGAGGGGGHH